MTARRDVLRWTGLLGAAGLAGCSAGEPERQAQAATGLDDMLLYETAAGPAVLSADTGTPTIPGSAGAVSPNGRWLATATTEGTGTRVTTKRTLAGDVVSAATLRGSLSTRAVSPDGRLVALVEAAGGDAYRPTGRSSTTIVVADGSGERMRLKLPGCLEPEAFGVEAGQLYVLDYLPPTAPDRYRVRMVELASGAFSQLATRDKRVIAPGGEEEMRGEGRQAVFDGGLARLFTLYVHGGDHRHTGSLIGVRPANPDVHAFVHTLAVNECWAYCIDLPAPFGDGPPESHAIARSNERRSPARRRGREWCGRRAGPERVDRLAGLCVRAGAGFGVGRVRHRGRPVVRGVRYPPDRARRAVARDRGGLAASCSSARGGRLRRTVRGTAERDHRAGHGERVGSSTIAGSRLVKPARGAYQIANSRGFVRMTAM